MAPSEAVTNTKGNRESDAAGLWCMTGLRWVSTGVYVPSVIYTCVSTCLFDIDLLAMPIFVM